MQPNGYETYKKATSTAAVYTPCCTPPCLYKKRSGIFKQKALAFAKA
ncbi:hypothetical protein [Niabella aurantiaca]|nr:hypothetical protein [Niabella aurantiaca]